MPEYAPTTEDVEDAYVRACYYLENHRIAGDEFERWLAEKESEIIRNERKRIINKLTEAYNWFDVSAKNDEDEYHSGRQDGIQGCINIINNVDAEEASEG